MLFHNQNGACSSSSRFPAVPSISLLANVQPDRGRVHSEQEPTARFYRPGYVEGGLQIVVGSI
jgi:hypothetical protein